MANGILVLLVALAVQSIHGEEYLAKHGAEFDQEIRTDAQHVQRDEKKTSARHVPTRAALSRPKRVPKQEEANSRDQLQKVTIEVERLFDSLNKRRSEIDRPMENNGNENEITVVIENDNDDADDAGDADDGGPNPSESGFAIILDNTNERNDGSTPKSTADDFSKMASSYVKMNRKFQRFLSEEKSHIPRASSPTLNPGPSVVGTTKPMNKKGTPSNPWKTTTGGQTTARSTIEADIQSLKQLRERLKIESDAIDMDSQAGLKQSRSKITENNSTSVESIENTENGLRVSHSYKKKTNILDEDNDQKAAGLKNEGRYTAGRNISTVNDEKSRTKTEVLRLSKGNGPKASPTDSRLPSIRSSKKYSPTTRTASATNKSTKNVENAASDSAAHRIIHPRKAGAMVEYLNKDPLESWFYKYQSLQALGLNSSMLRNGLVNAGSIDRLKSVMERALKGEDVTLSIVGGSISAGGGLYKDESNIAGLYYKGVVDWWNKVITPLTGSEMKVNNIAIGSIGTDYFSYCLKCHISNDSNIVLWELSGNDYNRYLKMPTKGAKPLERLTRMALELPRSPAIIYVNFFKGVDYKKTKKNCPNFEDQGEDIIAHYYKVPSLSWRAMVCESLINQNPLFTLKTLFCKDQYHPSLLAHAQMALLLILHLRHVMRSVLQYANSHDGILPNFASFYNLPAPLFVGLDHPLPLCWTLIAPDFKESIYNTLGVKVLDENGFKLEYATNFPIRFDRVICWKAEKVGALMKFQITLPEAKASNVTKTEESRKRFEIAITTHTRFGGSAEIWLDQRASNSLVIQEGRPNDTGKRTQVDLITQDAEPGVHTLNLKATKEGFCLASIMVF